MEKALFLDRDGTIIIDKGVNLNPNKIIFIEGLFQLLEAAKKRSFKIIVVTNQTVVSKGLKTYREMKILNDIILNRIKIKMGFNVFDRVYFCPFHPNANINRFRFDSYYRKPQPGMLFKAQGKFNLDLKNSLMVGDRISDIVAGNLAGCKTVMIKGKHNKSKIIESSLKIQIETIKPNYRVNKLVDIIPIMDGLI